MSPILPQKRRNRRRDRGAALVEAAVVIPTLLVFLGLIVFTYDSFTTKLDKQTNLRSASLYYASHNCEESLPGGTAVGRDGETVNTGGDTGKVDQGASNSGDSSLAAGTSRHWNMTRNQGSTVTVQGSAVRDGRKYSLQRPISSFSIVGCNERRHDNEWTKIFGFIKDFAQRGGGFIQ